LGLVLVARSESSLCRPASLQPSAHRLAQLSTTSASLSAPSTTRNVLAKAPRANSEIVARATCDSGTDCAELVASPTGARSATCSEWSRPCSTLPSISPVSVVSARLVRVCSHWQWTGTDGRLGRGGLGRLVPGSRARGYRSWSGCRRRWGPTGATWSYLRSP